MSVNHDSCACSRLFRLRANAAAFWRIDSINSGCSIRRWIASSHEPGFPLTSRPVSLSLTLESYTGLFW